MPKLLEGKRQKGQSPEGLPRSNKQRLRLACLASFHGVEESFLCCLTNPKGFAVSVYLTGWNLWLFRGQKFQKTEFHISPFSSGGSPFSFPLSPFHFFALCCNAAPHPRRVGLCVYVFLCVVYLFWIVLVRSLQEINLPHTESLGVLFRKSAVHHGALFGRDLVPSTYTKMWWKPHKRATVSNCSRSVTIRQEDPTTRPQRIINTDI